MRYKLFISTIKKRHTDKDNIKNNKKYTQNILIKTRVCKSFFYNNQLKQKIWVLCTHKNYYTFYKKIYFYSLVLYM